MPELFGHPKGLVYLAGTEFWERVSNLGMQALLLLYMVEQLLLPGRVGTVAGLSSLRSSIESITGPLSPQALAAQISGLFFGCLSLAPLLGGFLGDRVLGRRRTVILGALLMTAGHFSLGFDELFLVALALLVLGSGALYGNLISQLASLYASDDRRQERGIQLYYLLANTGAFVAPLITGILSQRFGWHYGFTFAGFGMLIATGVYAAGLRYIPVDEPRRASRNQSPLSARERRTVYILILSLPVLTLFWVGQCQVWNLYNLWARDSVNLTLGTWRMPVMWLQSFDGLAAIVAAPPVLWWWKSQARRGREPDEMKKMGLGCAVFATSLGWLALSESFWSEPAAKIPLGAVLVFHLVANVGWVFFAPTAVALYSRLAPARINALTVGIYNLSVFAGATISGRMGGLYETLSGTRFWLVHAAIVACGGALIFAWRPWLQRRVQARC